MIELEKAQARGELDEDTIKDLEKDVTGKARPCYLLPPSN